MKKHLKFLAVGAMALVVALFILLQTNTIKAGDYHQGAGLICSDCHTMHYSVDNADPPGGVGGPNDNLLKAGTNVLCLTCHDLDGGGGPPWAPDVMLIASANQAVYRSAGAFRAAAGTASTKAHNLGVAGVVQAPRGGWSTPATGLTCAHCHAVHGDANYRNLVLRPGNAAADIAVYATQTVTTPTLDQYKVANIQHRVNANNNPSLSNWCAGCHTVFQATVANQGGPFTNDANLGGADDGDQIADIQPWHRHPVTHVTMGEGNTNLHVDYAYYSNAGRLSRTPVASVGGVVPNADNVPFCGTCHKAHGSDWINTTDDGWPDNLIYDNDTTANLQDGDVMKKTCNICHNKG